MKNVEDIYPVSPMQSVMLLHALDPCRPTTRCSTSSAYRIDSGVDTDAFRPRLAAGRWTAMPALRTGFVWEKVKRPMQFVRRERTLPVDVLDWRDRPCRRT